MPRPHPAAALAVAVIGISVAAPLTRLSGAHPVTIAVSRLTFAVGACGALLVASGQRRQWRSLSPRDLAVALGAGLMLALHFWTWNTSLGLTSIAASVVLVDLQPVFVALLSIVWLHERPTSRQWTGIMVALAGAIIVGLQGADGSALGADRRALAGDALAIVGAITAALYYAAGRRLRGGLDLWAYVTLVYSTCLIALVAIALTAHVPLWPSTPRDVWISLGLAAGPMMLGHTGMNYALRHLPAYVVNLTVLGEAVGATLLAAVIPGIAEIPTVGTLVGGALVLAGIVVSTRRQGTGGREQVEPQTTGHG